YPYDNPPPTPLDRLTGCLIVAIDELARVSEQVDRTVNRFEHAMHVRLQYRCFRAFGDIALERQPLADLIDELAAEGEARLGTYLSHFAQGNPALQVDDILPLCTDPARAAALCPMDHVLFDTSPCFSLPDANPLEHNLFRMLGLVTWLSTAFPAWHQL